MPPPRTSWIDHVTKRNKGKTSLWSYLCLSSIIFVSLFPTCVICSCIFSSFPWLCFPISYERPRGVIVSPNSPRFLLAWSIELARPSPQNCKATFRGVQPPTKKAGEVFGGSYHGEYCVTYIENYVFLMICSKDISTKYVLLFASE